MRMSDVRIVKLATKVQFERGSAGGMFMDLPSHLTYSELEQLAANRKIWKRMAEHVGNLPAMTKYIQAVQSLSTTPATTTPTIRISMLSPTPTTVRPATKTTNGWKFFKWNSGKKKSKKPERAIWTDA